jgi:hypothetical protein
MLPQALFDKTPSTSGLYAACHLSNFSKAVYNFLMTSTSSSAEHNAALAQASSDMLTSWITC